MVLSFTDRGHPDTMTNPRNINNMNIKGTQDILQAKHVTGRSIEKKSIELNTG